VRKAVILAAGCGRRMGKLTRDRPKAALEVGGHALIDWQIAALRMAGVEEIAIVTGHAPDALNGRDATLIHNPDWCSGTQVDSLLCAKAWIGDDDVIVSYGDILYHPCAALALLERPGDIVIGYDPDHRWLWKRRFGNWLKDSETFRLGPGQVLTEIGGSPTDIEAIDGQFMGLMLFTAAGLTRTGAGPAGSKLDFTSRLRSLLAQGLRIDTAANLLPWMEIDSPKDLRLARRMVERDELRGTGPELMFPADLMEIELEAASDEPGLNVEDDVDAEPSAELRDAEPGRSYSQVRNYRVDSAFAVQNWGRSGSTFVQSLFDDHPQVLSTPNFYSRRYYAAWASRIGRERDARKIEAFLTVFRAWWDTGRVDATAGLHRLGPDRREIAGVDRSTLEGYLRAAFADGRPITRRSLFEAGHLAYALARGQQLKPPGLQILFPIHGYPRGTACALLEDFPNARFLHTLREPVANVASSIQHHCVNNFDLENDPVKWAIMWLFARRGAGPGRPSTRFLDRPYLPYLLHADQVRGMRLEDLHRDGANLMASAANWLGLVDDERLGQSTWDGKRWWNRPEIGRDSFLGAAPGGRNINHRLGGLDYARIQRLLAQAPHLKATYPETCSGQRFSWWVELATLLTPWRQEGRPRRSDLKSIEALLTLSPIWPRRFREALQAVLRRERYRARLLAMNAGTTSVREHLPNWRKPAAIRAVLIVTPTKDNRWRSRALIRGGLCDLEHTDRLGVAFLDEAAADRKLGSVLFWLVVLTAGRGLANLKTYASLRLLVLQLALSHRQRSVELPLLRGVDHLVESAAIAEMEIANL
jgi:choline kinase